jgi:tetratricopeptide (TPR) repeat protein
MPSSVRLASAGAILALLTISTPLGAAGGGGGGGGGGGSMPSDSAPRYDPVVEYQKGVAALQASNFKDAKRAFDRVLAVAPKDANTLYMAGLANDGLGKPKDASKLYEKALKSDKAHVGARQALALALVKLGDSARAQAELDTLKAAAATCGGGCADSAKLDAAVKAVGAALAGQQAAQAPLPPPQTVGALGDVLYGEAVALINLRRYDAALGSLYHAAEAFGPHPDVLTYLGYTQRKLGRADRAEDYYRQALAVAPEHRGALEYYGELKVERGDLAGARANLAKLEAICRFGCYEAEELRRWIVSGPPATS